MDSETLELIFKAKDEATAVVNNLRAALDSIPNSAKKISEAKDEIAAAFEKLRISTTTSMEAQKAAINSAYLAIKNSATSTANEITRAEAARAKAIEQIDSQNFATRKGLLDSLKSHWLAVTGAIVAAWATINQAKEYINLGAAALQAEESFKQVTNAYGVDGDRLIAKLKEVSVGAIDESAMMQRAVKALQQGLSPDQIVQLMEVARSSARIAGIDIKDAFDRITEATANQMTRGLKALGIIIDQNKAYEDYARELGIAKDALNEQQQSQALANAAIAEGLRQRQAMNISLVNEAEQLQINKARFEELKETIGKELLNVLGLAAKNIDAIAIALAAAALMNAPRVIAAIIASLRALAVQSVITSATMTSVWVALAALLGYVLGKAIDDLAYKIAGIDLSGLHGPIERTEIATRTLEKNTKELNARLKELGFIGPDAWEKYEVALKSGNIATDKATGAQKNLAEVLKQTIAISQAQIATLSASSQYYIELVKKDFETGKITMDKYVAFVKKKQDEITQAQIANAQLRIQELKKEYDMKKISEDEMKAKIAVVNEEIKQLNIKAGQENTQIWAEAEKIKEQGLEKTKKTQEEEFAHWKSLQELKLQSLKSHMDLENTIDEVAAQKGLISQTEYLERKIQRVKVYYEQEIAIAAKTAEEEAQLYGQDSIEFQKAIEKKVELQNQLQGEIIKSEKEITEAKAKEAEASIVVTEEATKKMSIAFTEQAGSVSEAAAKILEFWKDMSRTIGVGFAGENLLVEYWLQRLKDSVKKEYGDILATIQYTTGKATESLDTLGAMGIKSLSQAQSLLSNLWSSAAAGLDVFYYQMATLGKQTIATVGMTSKEWIQQVADYVNRVRELLASLREQISSYQDELDQLRGNDEAILDRWYQRELEQIKERYGKELQSSQEYQEARQLLEELYAEKRKKLREQEQQDTKQFYSDMKDMSQGEKEAGGASISLGKLLPIELPWKNFAANLTQSVQTAVDEVNKAFGEGLSIGPKELKVTKEVNLTSKFEINAFDNDTLKRLAREVLFPEWERQLELRGIKL